MLAKLKGLRGTSLDFFGKTEERQTERALVGEYVRHIDRALASLNSETHSHAVKVAQVPENIKGYGHVKERNIRAARALWASLSAS
jgi:indolepyruvate ferredoxin oxidoreductase